jgi:phage antirepressor YoqD-like protein
MTDDTLEKALTSPDFLIQLATQLKEAKNQNKALEVKVSALTVDKQIMQPKADYFDELVDRKLNTGIRETAKELHIKQNIFVKFLLDHKYLYRVKAGGKLMPHAKYVETGIFELKEFVNEKTGYSSTQTLITPKGKETFRLLLIGK